MAEHRLRWGILGSAAIARKNWKAIHASGNSVVTALASRDLERARRYIAERQAEAAFASVPRAFGSYEELIACPEVDAVYIPLPTGLRKEWVIRAAQAGKHVLSEKPCGINAADVREILETCRRHRVQFMDGVMLMHHERLDRIRTVLNDSASIGSLKRITSAFCFLGAEDFFGGNVRLHSALEPSGCLGDLGWYCIRFALWVMNWQLPEKVSGRILAEVAGPGGVTPVPTEFSGELFFAGGVSSSFYCSFLSDNRQWAEISGAKGYLRVPDFVLPDSRSQAAFEVNYQPVLPAAPAELSQEAKMFRNFTAQVRSGKLNEAWPEMALKTQQVTDACFTAARDGAGKLRLLGT